MISLIFTSLIVCNIAVHAEESRPPRVLVLGDSIAAGYGLDLAQAFPAHLQRIADSENFGVEIINAGLSGETSAGGARRITWVLKQRIDILLIELGGNDALRGLNPAHTESNLRAIIATALAHHPKLRIVLAGMKAPPNLGSEFTSRFENVYRRIASDTHIPLIPFVLEGVGGVNELNQADGIHPTEAGQRIIADTVWPYLKREIESLALSSTSDPAGAAYLAPASTK